jgi:putative nucleotide binding protein
MEDHAHILDYLAKGHPDTFRYRREPVAYALGESEFKLLELVPKPSVSLQIGDRVYIGKDMDLREKVQHVKRRISYTDLTSSAQSELPYVILELVRQQQERFVKFYNEAQAISTRYHMLELLPGLGKKTMWSIIEARKQAPFETFEDLEERVTSLHKPDVLISRRIEDELADPDQKYHLFVAR